MILTYTRFLLLSSIAFIAVTGDSEHLKEMRFKFWLQPDTQECYHELLENGTSIYLMYEILNAHEHDSSIIAYFRNAYNGSILAISTTPQRGHLQLIANETTLVDICMTHEKSDTYVKYISVFFHRYHLENILASIKEVEHFDNSSINAHNAIDAISYQIIVTREQQIEMEMLNQKDLYLVEQNLVWVNRWAIMHIFLIISCSLFQTFFIRRLFQTPTVMKRMK
ncbi:unnamed protein product [Rotaria socialis]|uniref:GOLD domain-containing protein n=1 Tax=Rotaria socialis TaxID=392032 RepID=A0A819VKD7_9BILA|nr:unnamed protein product [Rotaria socialis]CAF3347889.1 unnamed protein product [Rotaria socialis]CAF3351383.1 unnamed protein product [Rotaria socialis]CAF3430624.1 unnamed protein product [Rotaria socialis]CAF3443804.1 unnamed protein product [Rotaria socialis]